MKPATRVLVTGAGGFIGHHLVKRLKAEGYWVRGVDIKEPEFEAYRGRRIPTSRSSFLAQHATGHEPHAPGLQPRGRHGRHRLHYRATGRHRPQQHPDQRSHAGG